MQSGTRHQPPTGGAFPRSEKCALEHSFSALEKPGLGLSKAAVLAPRSTCTARLCSFALPLAAALGIGLASGDAAAGPNDNSASRPWSLHGGFGPAVSFRGGVLGRFQFDMEYHFKGGDVGPALGFYIPLNFTATSVGVNVGPVFLWDFRLGEKGNAKFYLGPLLATGYGFHAGFFRGPPRPLSRYHAHFWFLHLGAHFRILWNDRIGIFARPANFEVWAGPNIVTGLWSFVGGLAAAF